MKPFRYGRDRLCLLACALYLINRVWLKPMAGHGFLHDHFNDLLLIPAGLPWVLWVQRLTGLRQVPTPPTANEVCSHVVIWCVICEWLGPTFLHVGTGDWKDAAAYVAGGFLSWTIWNRTSRIEHVRV